MSAKNEIPTHPIPFRALALRSLSDPELRATLSLVVETFTQKRQEALAGLPWEEWRERLSSLRLQILNDLPAFVHLFAARARAVGATVHQALDAKSACEIVTSILREREARRVVKSKSMISEEIHLNQHLREQGIEAIETDLGEYINQLAGHGPSHLIVPAIHHNRRRIGQLFAHKLNVPYTEDPVELTRIARKFLREEFLRAQAGITGANFAVAETGSLVLFTNEGNGRLVTTLPPLHLALVSIDKMIPSTGDLPLVVRLLPRSATGQILTSYLSVITGAREAAGSWGAHELHIVLVDNGRSRILASPYREMLKCIRCGACSNACPIYRLVGGHAYGSTYPGPMGAVLTALLEGMERAHPLLDGSTLCGACAEVCPAKVPLVTLLRRLREQKVEARLTPWVERAAMAGWACAVRFPLLYRLGKVAAGVVWPVAKRIGRNTVLGRMPDFAPRFFRRRIW